MVLLRSSALSR
ncbi:unnamed protein product [Fusarium graminearum]|nr:unnamed protein product [Fusarium graminearum]VTO91036.1 unnamed protein product [Fusarium graminearum]